MTVGRATPSSTSFGFADAVNSGDLEAALDHWTSDAVLIAPDGSEARGSDEIRKRLTVLMASGAKVRIEVGSVIETAHVAVATTRMGMTIPDSSERAVEFTATVVYTRASDGWRMAIDELAVPSGSAASPSNAARKL